MADDNAAVSSSPPPPSLSTAPAWLTAQQAISFVPVYFPFSRYRTLTFSAGFLCGQASLIFIAVLFLRYVVFEDPKIAMREAEKRKKKRLKKASSKRQRRPSTSLNARKGAGSSLFGTSATIPQSDALVLEKLGYDLASHPSESLDWLNILVAQAVVLYRAALVAAATSASTSLSSTAGKAGGGGGASPGDSDDQAEQGSRAKRFVEEALNQARGARENDQGFVTLDYITVTEFELGQDYPAFSNARVRPSNESGKVRIEVDIDYSDHLSLGIETRVRINFPKPGFAIIPVSLALALVRFSATVILEVSPPISNSQTTLAPALGEAAPATAGTASLAISLYPDFLLELASTSLIGSRAKLQDIPKVEQLIIGRIRAWVNNNLVWPKTRRFKLPSVHRKPSTNEPQYDERNAGGRGDQQQQQQLASRESRADSPESAADSPTSPEGGSALDDDDDEEDADEDEEEDEEDDRSEISRHRQGGRDPYSDDAPGLRQGRKGNSSSVAPATSQQSNSSTTPREVTIEAFTSAFEKDPPPSHALLHHRRRSSSQTNERTSIIQGDATAVAPPIAGNSLGPDAKDDDIVYRDPFRSDGETSTKGSSSLQEQSNHRQSTPTTTMTTPRRRVKASGSVSPTDAGDRRSTTADPVQARRSASTHTSRRPSTIGMPSSPSSLAMSGTTSPTSLASSSSSTTNTSTTGPITAAMLARQSFRRSTSSLGQLSSHHGIVAGQTMPGAGGAAGGGGGPFNVHDPRWDRARQAARSRKSVSSSSAFASMPTSPLHDHSVTLNDDDDDE